MIKLDSETLRKLQMTELEMLKEVDRICRKYNIKYSLDGGTLLGAIRHDGFIPWDDDADVVMLRPEYKRFYHACKRELDTIFLREGQEHGNWNQSVFIDIFVYDHVPDHYIFRRLHLFLCFCIRKGLYSEVGKKNAPTKLMRDWYALLNKIPRNRWIKLLEIIADITDRKRTELVRHMTYPYRKECRYGLPRECFDEYIEKDFEGYRFKIFKNYDLYLMRLYGDYRKLPPIKKRKIHPVSEIKLID